MPRNLSRRALIQAAALLPMSGLIDIAAAASTHGFTHSVASGDPGQHDVVLWTRYVPRDGSDQRLAVEVAEDEGFARIISRGETVAGPLTDFCAQARPNGLKPGRWYFYRFRARDGAMSPVGRTRTLPKGPLERFHIAVFSCANATSGWFNAYAHAAAREDLHLLIHTGDYIYESPTDRADALAALALARDIQPVGEAVSLSDYRQRYASYRRDAGLMELHRRFPMIVMWDDHEVANNAWADGAKNHGTDEGPWAARKVAGLRAFHEWLPTAGANYARYQIGDLATLFRLETRLLARSRQLDPRDALGNPADFRDGALADPARTLMGGPQERWLADGLKASTAARTRWQILAQQVIMAPIRLPKVTGAWYASENAPSSKQQAELAAAELLQKAGIPAALDRWDGYPAARRRLFESAHQVGADLVVLSGDSHNGWASDLQLDGKAVGVEFGGHSVSSLGLEKRFDGDAALIGNAFREANPLLRWCDTSRRGYMTVRLSPSAIESTWLFLHSRERQSVKLVDTAAVSVAHGVRALVR